MTTRYVYDTTNPHLLRFVVSATGEVTETQYNASGAAQGLASMARRFTVAAYDTSALQPTDVLTLANMTAWIAGKGHPRAAAVVPALMVMAGEIGMIVQMPGHPLWMAVAGLLLPIPAALAGAALAARLKRS